MSWYHSFCRYRRCSYRKNTSKTNLEARKFHHFYTAAVHTTERLKRRSRHIAKVTEETSWHCSDRVLNWQPTRWCGCHRIDGAHRWLAVSTSVRRYTITHGRRAQRYASSSVIANVRNARVNTWQSDGNQCYISCFIQQKVTGCNSGCCDNSSIDIGLTSHTVPGPWTYAGGTVTSEIARSSVLTGIRRTAGQSWKKRAKQHKDYTEKQGNLSSNYGL